MIVEGKAWALVAVVALATLTTVAWVYMLAVWDAPPPREYSVPSGIGENVWGPPPAFSANLRDSGSAVVLLPGREPPPPIVHGMSSVGGR